MGDILIDAGNPDNWNPLWNTTVNSVSTPGGEYYYPIPDIEVPLLLDKFAIAVYADSETARPTWVSAGFMNQKIRTGITVGGNTDANFSRSNRILLKQIGVFVLPRITSEYSISFSIHPWHEDISLQVWEFTGVVADSTEDLITDIRVRELADIESKVDQIIGGSS